jgi:hypothetical protein
MDPKQDRGGAKRRETIAGWVINLLMQRGFSYSLNSEITLNRSELADFLVGQGLSQDRQALESEIDAVVQAHAGVLTLREDDGETWLVSTKKKLLTLPGVSQPAAAAGPAPRPAAPKPAPVAPAEAKRPAPAPEPKAAPAAEAPAAGEIPITQQYQLAVLQAVQRQGGTGKTADIVAAVPKFMAVPQEHLQTYTRGAEGKSEQPKYIKFAQSALQFLKKNGEVENPSRGVWSITPAGMKRLKQAGILK